MGVPALLVIYVGVFGVLALLAGFIFTKATIASEEADGRAEREKTVLNGRIESAREIRRALARPVPPPDPLPPITAKLAHPEKVAKPDKLGRVASGKTTGEKPAKLKIPAAAWNAMAKGETDATPPKTSTFDRPDLNGW